jgi:hypothetical protein
MKQLILDISLVFLFLTIFHFAKAQDNYEPIHGVTGHDFNIKGELELTFTHSIDLKNGTKSEATYRIKSPVQVSFNLNDLKFFKANPGEFVGYVENQYDAYSGYSSGGLIDIPQGGYQEEENWMWVDEHVKCWENGELTEINAQGEIYPVLKVAFSIPDYPERYKAGLDQLRFRVTISGISDSQFHQTRNVVVDDKNKNQQENGTVLSDDEGLRKLEQADPSVAAGIKEGLKLIRESSESHSSNLSVSIGCGSFYGQDLLAAEMSGNLLMAAKSKKEAFERQFEQEYFKDMPHINVMKLVKFLLKPEDKYETPIVGSFSSDSEAGSEKATYNGTLRLYGNKVQKSDQE